MTLDQNLVPDEHIVVLFGATGDLARRELLPGLFRLARAGLLPERCRIIATSRRNLSDQWVRDLARGAVEESGQRPCTASWETFAGNLSFAPHEALVDAVTNAESQLGDRARRLFYLSVPPGAFNGIVTMLGASGLSENASV